MLGQMVKSTTTDGLPFLCCIFHQSAGRRKHWVKKHSHAFVYLRRASQTCLGTSQPMSSCSRYGCSRAPASSSSPITRSHSFQISRSSFKHTAARHCTLQHDTACCPESDALLYRTLPRDWTGSTGRRVNMSPLKACNPKH